MTRLSAAFPWAAAALAAVAAAAGLFAGVYRDVPAMVEQAQAADVATLFVAVPLLVIALLRRAEVVTFAALAYLAYTYAIFSFEIVLNPLAPVYIGILSMAVWAVVGRSTGLRDMPHATLPRRTVAGFLGVVAFLFAALWLSDIAASISSGALPPAVAALNVPTSAVYALDLGFVLPVFAIAAIGLVRRKERATPLALGSLVFLVLMALSILPMFAFEAFRGDAVDPVAPTIFIVIAVVATILVVASGRQGSRVRGVPQIAPA